MRKGEKDVNFSYSLAPWLWWRELFLLVPALKFALFSKLAFASACSCVN